MEKENVVMTFGVFDLLHNGHRHLFAEARKLGTKIIAVLASDNAVKALKGRFPANSFLQRAKNLERESLADVIILGDEALGSWTAITKYNPGAVALGYDQTELAESLEEFIKKNLLPIKLVKIKPYKNKTLHSSALR